MKTNSLEGVVVGKTNRFTVGAKVVVENTGSVFSINDLRRSGRFIRIGVLGWIVLEGLNRLNLEVVARGGEEVVVVVGVDVVELSKDSEIISSTFVTGNIWLDEDEELGSKEVVVINELEVGGGEGDDGDTMLKTRKKQDHAQTRFQFFIFQTFQLFSNDLTEHGFDFIPKEFPIDSAKYQLHPLVKSQHVKC